MKSGTAGRLSGKQKNNGRKKPHVASCSEVVLTQTELSVSNFLRSSFVTEAAVVWLWAGKTLKDKEGIKGEQYVWTRD